MNIKSIKSEKEFYEFADIWYQRSHRLRYIWQSVDESEERREQALDLWLEMYRRIKILQSFATRLSISFTDKFETGCIVNKNVKLFKKT